MNGTKQLSETFLGKTMETESSGWDFEATFFGGPCDGLQDEVLAVDDTPPEVWWIELKDGVVKREKLGMKVLNTFFNRTPQKDTKVAVYKIEDVDALTYKYEETLLFEEFATKYKESSK